MRKLRALHSNLNTVLTNLTRELIEQTATTPHPKSATTVLSNRGDRFLEMNIEPHPKSATFSASAEKAARNKYPASPKIRGDVSEQPRRQISRNEYRASPKIRHILGNGGACDNRPQENQIQQTSVRRDVVLDASRQLFDRHNGAEESDTLLHKILSKRFRL
jgi:hypothetical protein